MYVVLFAPSARQLPLIHARNIFFFLAFFFAVVIFFLRPRNFSAHIIDDHDGKQNGSRGFGPQIFPTQNIKTSRKEGFRVSSIESSSLGI